MSIGLTREASRLLEFMKSYRDENRGTMPTFAEMAAAVGLKSRGGVARLMDQLEERGAIRRVRNRARAVEIVGDGLLEKAREMRNAIDAIEGALMGCGDLVELPRIFEGGRDDLVVLPKMTIGQARRVCRALEECTRIVNSGDFVFGRSS